MTLPELHHFIGGDWKPSTSGATREIINPANNRIIALAAEGGVEDVASAIRCARNAFDTGSWQKTTGQERAALLLKLAESLDSRAEEFAVAETTNNGKPLRESRGDVADAANCFRYYAGLATKPLGQTFSVSDPSIVCMVVREPVGVCAQIIPWNYPLLMAAWKLAPALAAGNCCILKPAEATPLTAVMLYRLIADIGFPPGVVQLVLGAGGTVGAALAESRAVDKVAFTGGTMTGRKILMAAAGNIKKVTLELGGKSPNIIFADADLDVALEFALFGIFAGQGEVCSAGSRLLVQRSLAESFLPRVAEGCRRIIVGDGLQPGTEMGPLITPAHEARVLDYIRLGREEGAELMCGGTKLSEGGLAEGNFVEPTIFIHTRPDMRIVREEIFGPVLAVQLFDEEEDAIRIANDSDYGLAGGVFTRDGSKGLRVLKRLRAGITWLNTYHPTFNEAPWGGYKQSGIGRELGTFGMEAYLETKQMNLHLAPQRIGWFSGISGL